MRHDESSSEGADRLAIEPVLLTERAVCERLGVGRTTLRTLALRPVHINRCVRYLSTEVHEYIEYLRTTRRADAQLPWEQPGLPFDLDDADGNR